MQAVATRLLGEPNKAHSNPTQMRFGNHGSLSIDLEKGVYHDHEAGEGGGVLDLIITNVPSVKSSLEARKWIEQEIGFDSAPPPVANGALNIKRPSVRTEVGRYEYLNADKTLAYTVVKYEQNGRKTYRPFCLETITQASAMLKNTLQTARVTCRRSRAAGVHL